MKQKKYEKALDKLQVQLCLPPALGQGEGRSRSHPVRRT